MSFVEKRSWIELLVILLVAGWYFVDLWGQLNAVPVSQIDYRPMLFWNIGILVVVLVVVLVTAIVFGHVGSAVAKEVADRKAASSEMRGSESRQAVAYAGEMERTDERDRSIGRLGGSVGGAVLAAGAAVVLVLAMFEFQHFWIANALYASLVLSTLASSGARIVAYRTGL